MSFPPGARLGPYEIAGSLGAGGMGEVYRARDSRLNRDVALKVLPEAFAGDADRLARFTREAQVLASLNHPGIAAIYGIEANALVMELVEGEDLSEKVRSRRGRREAGLPLDEALPIARQIAVALEAAHDQGIVHRDLKPANVKVRADGTVKVLDFGLAKALETGSGVESRESGVGRALADSPTVTTPAMTKAGVILGTAAYMSPEQARGRPVDRRADIWAFGCVLFEMLTGRRAFPGDNVTDTLAAVVRAEPEWSLLPPALSPTLLMFLRRSLQKDPQQRLGDIRDMRLALEGAFDAAGTPVTAEAPPLRRQTLASKASIALAAVVIGAMAIPTIRHLRETMPPETRVDIVTPATSAPLDFSLSPDGRQLVFVASGDGSSRLWLRALDQAVARPLAGTEGAETPFWSPDSRSIGFFVGPRLARVDTAGGSPRFLINTGGTPRGGSWNTEGTILFAAFTGAISSIAASGGEPVPVTRLNSPSQVAHRFPRFLPDGRRFIYYAVGPQDSSGLYLTSLDGGVPRRLAASDSSGAFLKPDWVVFIRQGALVARRLDLGRGELTGDIVTIADRAGSDAVSYLGGFSVSDGQLAYRIGGATMQLTWFDRTGKAVGVAGEPDASGPQYPELSPDGQQVAMTRAVLGNSDIWLMDLARGGPTRLTFDSAQNLNPVWSPDGMRIAYGVSRKGAFDLFVKPSNGSRSEEVLLESPNTKVIQDWSRDGSFLLYYEVDPRTGRDLWAMELTGDQRQRRLVANTPFEETLAQLSPDGHWVAYQTNESGRFEIVVQSFPDAAGKWQVSTGGGVAPRWRADGREICFLAPDATMMAAAVSASGTAFQSGTPMALFQTRVLGGGSVPSNRAQYDIARDGRFLINQRVNDATAAPITLILNWHPERRP